MGNSKRIQRTIAKAVVISTMAFAVVSLAQASTITSANDYPSTLESGQGANHRLLFTTPTGISEGSTITLSFSSSFDTSIVIEDDFDIADDGVDLTTASDCSGTEQASVTVASDVATVTICSGDGGAIAAGSAIAIEIGTNATSSGIGSHQIVNPSTVGTYFLTVAGTFGDDGSIALPIVLDNTVGVSASVPSSGGGGDGGGSPTPGDTAAPSISSVVVSSITATSATVTWTTNELATSAVDYGLTASFESGTVSSASLYTSHSLTLTGLHGAAMYYFRVRSSDASGNQATSSTQTFSTLDNVAPVISGIQAVDITTASARIIWTTNELSTSVVSYGLSTSYRSTVTDSTLVTAHSVILTGLTDGTTYHFQVLSTDAYSNQSFSSDYTFVTDIDEPPTNVSGLSLVPGNSRVALSWDNPIVSDLAGVLVLVCTDGYPSGPTDSDCEEVFDSIGESVVNSGLTNRVTYYYGVFAYDRAGQFASGALGSGTPRAPEEELPPPPEEEEEPGDEDLPSDEEPTGDEETPGGDEESGEEEGPGGGETEDGLPPSEVVPSGSAVSCGNGLCSDGETVLSCPLDCGALPTSLDAEESVLGDSDIRYSVENGSIALSTTRSGVVDVIPASTLRVSFPDTQIDPESSSVELRIGSDHYLFRLDEASALYSADVTVPDESGIFTLTVLVKNKDGSSQEVSSYLRVVNPGRVYQVVDGEETFVPDAEVTLFEVVGGTLRVWDGSPYDQFNPTSVSADGTYYWYVPNATYVVRAQAPEFLPKDSSRLVIANSIVAHDILLTAIAQEEEEPAEAIIPRGPMSTLEVVNEVISAIVDKPMETINETLDVIRDVPGVQEVSIISTPALALSAGASVIVMSFAFDFLPFLQYFFTAPVLLFWRRKRKEYGVIYNAISKTPIDLAVVRLYKLSDQDEASNGLGRLVKSRVADKGGRYFFLASPGKYRVVVTKSGFQFPSAYLNDDRTDGQYMDVYHGEIIEVKGQDVVITANIPMDPSQVKQYQAPKAVMRRARLRFVQHLVAVLGVIASVMFAILRPTSFAIGMVVVQAVIYLLARRLAKPIKPISWGIVYDKQTRRPISQVIARVFEPKYNKLLETQVTDSKGRYAFLLGPNEYFAVFEKEGFETREVRPIDYRNQKEVQSFSKEIALEPKAQEKENT